MSFEDEIVKVDTTGSALFSEVGRPGLKQFAGWVQEDFLTTLIMPSAAKIYKEMSWNDPTIGGVLFMVESLVKKTTWTVQAGGTSPVDLEIKDFVVQCLDDMQDSWRDVVTEALTEIVYGFSWQEIIFKLRKGDVRDPRLSSKYNDGRIGWRKISGRAQDTLDHWEFDDFGQVTAMVQVACPDYKTRVIPYDKSILFRTVPGKNNPEGRSLLRNAYRPWYFKKHIEEIEGIGIERDLAGLPVMHVPDGLDIWNANDERMTRLRTRAESVVKNVRRDTSEGIVLPFGWTLELLSTTGGRLINTSEVINRWDQRIAITLLADIALLGADKAGSFALADVKKSLLASALEAIIQGIADVMNKRPIPQLIRLNNFKGYTDYPKLIPGQIEVPDLYEIAEYLDKVRGMGVQLFPDDSLEAYLRSIADLPEKNITPGFEEKPKVPSEEDEEEEESPGGPAGMGSRGGDSHNNQYNETQQRDRTNQRGERNQ